MSTRDFDWRRASHAALALSLGQEPIGDLSPDEVCAAANYHGLVYEAHATAESLGLHDVERRLRPVARQLVLRGLSRFIAALQMLRVLQDAGIPAVGIKGFGLAAQTRKVPMGRPSADVDLLILPENIVGAHEALTAAGGRLGERFPVPSNSLAFSMVTRWRQEAGYSIFAQTLDLHWHLGLGRHLLPTSQEAVGRVVDVSVGGTLWPTLCPSDALVHSAVHWRAGAFRRLKYVLDIEALAAQVSSGDQMRLPRAIREVMAVSHGLATADPQWRPRYSVPDRQWNIALAEMTPPPPADMSLSYRFKGLMTQLRGTPGARDRAMIPIRAAIGPLTRQYERLTGTR